MLNSALPGAPPRCAQFTHYCLGAFTVKCCMSFLMCGLGLGETFGRSPGHLLPFVEQTLIKRGRGLLSSPPPLLLFLIFALWSSFLKTFPLWFSPSHIFATSPSSKDIRGALWLPPHERRKTVGKQSSVFVLHCPLWLWHFYALLPIAHVFCQHNISCYVSVHFCFCAAWKIQ